MDFLSLNQARSLGLALCNAGHCERVSVADTKSTPAMQSASQCGHSSPRLALVHKQSCARNCRRLLNRSRPFLCLCSVQSAAPYVFTFRSFLHLDACVYCCVRAYPGRAAVSQASFALLGHCLSEHMTAWTARCVSVRTKAHASDHTSEDTAESTHPFISQNSYCIGW